MENGGRNSKDGVNPVGYSQRVQDQAEREKPNLLKRSDGKVESQRENLEGEEGKKRDINGRMATCPTESGESIIASRSICGRNGLLS